MPAPIDAGLAAIITAVITGIVAVIGHLILQQKNKTEAKASHVEGFRSLTDSLQSQITDMRTEMKELHHEVDELKNQKFTLQVENHQMKTEIQTKDEVIFGFTRWHELWQKWFHKLSAETELIEPPPEYTWQMRQYLSDVERVTEKIKNRRIQNEQSSDPSGDSHPASP